MRLSTMHQNEGGVAKRAAALWRTAATALLAMSLVVAGSPAAASVCANLASESSVSISALADTNPVVAGDGSATVPWKRTGAYFYIATVWPTTARVWESQVPMSLGLKWCRATRLSTTSSCTINGPTNDVRHTSYLYARDYGGDHVDHLSQAHMANSYPI